MKGALILIVIVIAAIPGVLAASVAESSLARLIVFDSTDTQNPGVSNPVTLFASFWNASTNTPLNGSCAITLSAAGIQNQPMTLNWLGDNRFNYSIAPLPEGDHAATVICSAPGVEALSASELVSVRRNTNLSIVAPSVVDAGAQAIFAAAFVNTSSSSRVTTAQCLLHVDAEAGEPLHSVMGFNGATGLYEARRAFSWGMNVSYNVSCTAPGLDPAAAASSILVKNILPQASRFSSAATTKFSDVPNLDSVQVTLANEHGRISWTTPMNATVRDFDSFVRIGPSFVSVNVPGLGAGYNSSVEVALYQAASSVVVAAPGFWSSASEIKALGNPCTPSTTPACTDLLVAGSTISFHASFPFSFGLGADANLSVGSAPAIAQFTMTAVIANYSNATNGAVISNIAPFNGECAVSFSPNAGEPLSGVMALYPSGVYQLFRQFNQDGTIAYNVTCQSDPFALLQGNSSLIVVPVSQPQAPAPQPAAAPVPPPQDVPPGPVENRIAEESPSRTLVATSGGVTTSFQADEEADLRVLGVTVRVGVGRIAGGSVESRLGPERGNLSQGQELAFDVDKDGTPDVTMQVLGIARDSVKVMIKRLRGQDEDLDEAGTIESKKKPEPITVPERERQGLSWWWFVLIVLALAGLGKWYFEYNQRMRHRFL